MHLTVCFCHVTYKFQVKSIILSCLNVEHLRARNRSEIWSLSKCNHSRSHNHLVPQKRLNHLKNVTEWLRSDVGTYLYNAFDCIFLSCHVRISMLIHNLYLSECRTTRCSNQERNLNFKELHLFSNLQPFSSLGNTQPFDQRHEMIKLRCEYLSLQWIWLYVFVMSRAKFRLNP